MKLFTQEEPGLRLYKTKKSAKIFAERRKKRTGVNTRMYQTIKGRWTVGY